jgi:hypothetical protein
MILEVKPMPKCIFCENELTEDTKREHILLNAFGGRKTTRRADCSECNANFGNTIDDEAAQQVKVLRNMLHLESGTGQPPPILKNVQSGQDTINLTHDGRPELVAKPFTVEKRDDDRFDVRITATSIEEMARFIPHIAAQIGRPEEDVIQMLESATASFTERRPDTVHHRLSFGGPLALRSIAKSCLALWATRVGNEEVRSAAYDDARRFVVDGDEVFNRSRVHLDSRYLPQVDELKRRFGKLFNLIYVKSNEIGRVVAHFTLYNIISWRIVLAEAGGTPNIRIGLVSNPFDRKWSDAIADDIDIDFGWLDSPDYSDEFVRARARINDVVRHYYDSETPRELHRIADEVFKKYGIATDDEPISDPELLKRIVWEISPRFAFHALNLPYVENLTGAEIADQLKKLRGKVA